MDQNEPKRYLKASEVCEYLGISRNNLDSLVEDGKLPHPKVLGPKTRRWDKAELDECMREK